MPSECPKKQAYYMHAKIRLCVCCWLVVVWLVWQIICLWWFLHVANQHFLQLNPVGICAYKCWDCKNWFHHTCTFWKSFTFHTEKEGACLYYVITKCWFLIVPNSFSAWYFLSRLYHLAEEINSSVSFRPCLAPNLHVWLWHLAYGPMLLCCYIKYYYFPI